MLSLLTACSEQSITLVPTAEEIYRDFGDYGGRAVEKIEIRQAEEVIREIRIDEERWKGEAFGPVRLGLPYEAMSWAADKQGEAFAAWDPLVAGGRPALVVQEYVSGGTAPGSHRWLMRIFLWESGELRELTAIPGAGEVYYFKDLNGDGSLEFVNHEGLSQLDVSPEGLPLSPRVFRFTGKRFVPVADGKLSSGS